MTDDAMLDQVRLLALTHDPVMLGLFFGLLVLLVILVADAAG